MAFCMRLCARTEDECPHLTAFERSWQVYDKLDGLQRELAKPGLTVTSPSFMTLLTSTDEAIAQLTKTAHFAGNDTAPHALLCKMLTSVTAPPSFCGMLCRRAHVCRLLPPAHHSFANRRNAGLYSNRACTVIDAAADSTAYLQRFRQVQARALALVQGHVTGLLQGMTNKLLLNASKGAPGQAAKVAGPSPAGDGGAVAAAAAVSGGGNGPAAVEASGAGAGGSSSSTAIEMSLSYVQFQSVADAVKETLDKIASRVSHGKEYMVVLNECRQSYFRQRRTLLLDAVRGRLAAAAAEGKGNLGEVARQGCLILCDVCHREYKLLLRFMPAVDAGEGHGLDMLMDPLCDCLIDMLRPLYLKVVDVDELCALVVILKGEVLEEQIELRGASLACMRGCVGTLLHEVQERLTFRAQMYIRDDIQAFAPSPDDLNYPLKLLALAKGPSPKAGGGGGGLGAGGAGIWLPVVPRTLACLSQLYRSVDKKIFEGIAQDAVLACTDALVAASLQIEKKQGSVEATLFLVMHLLKVREQIVPFDIDFASTDINLDFRDTRGEG